MAESGITSVQHVASPIAVDTESTENDSAYGDEISNYTASLTSSVLAYRKENGRSYHAYCDGHYLGPNDEQEMDRLDMMHEMMLTMTGRKLFLAPIGESPRRALDLGTGTAGYHVADQFPSAEVIGNDLSPIQPNNVPPNLKFIVDNFEDEWVYGNKRFDFIHARYLAGSVKDFKRLLEQCYKHTAPGGWVEFQDWNVKMYSEDGTLEGTSINQYYETVIAAFEKAGYVTSPGPLLENWFREAGFVDIHIQKYQIPMGTWPKDKHYKLLGTWNLMQAETGFEAGAMAVLTRYEGWSKDEVSILVARTKNDAKNRAIHGINDFYIVYGRKPE
ncbi:S-adenosyl-L-methionine-dependent methyltransferase [Thermoascus aurantiacus ATCC 26904]